MTRRRISGRGKNRSHRPGFTRLRPGLRRGFTLMELVIVIGLIGVLTSIVLVAVNPNKNVLTTLDATRLHGAGEIEKAMLQYLIEKGSFLNDSSLATTKGGANYICAKGVTNISGCLNMDGLVPGYLAVLPQDSEEPCANYNGFKVYKDGGVIHVFGANMGKIKKNITTDPLCNSLSNSPLIAVTDAGNGNAAVSNGATIVLPATTVGNQLSRTFNITNNGNASLTLAGAGVTGDYSITSAFTSPVASGGGSTSITVRLNATVNGSPSQGVLTFTTNVTGSTTFTITLQSTVTTASTLANGLVGYWKLDETSGTTAVDSSVSANNGTYVGAPTQSVDVPTLQFSNPRSVNFSGADRIGVPSSAALRIAGAMSFAFWGKGTWNSGNFQRFIQKGNTGGEVGYGCAWSGSAKVDCWYVTAAGTEYRAGITPPSNGVWHNLVVTYDGATTVKIYVDGVEGTGVAGSSGYGSTTAELSIGNRAGAASQGYVGNADEVRVYNRVLTPTEITSLAAGNN